VVGKVWGEVGGTGCGGVLLGRRVSGGFSVEKWKTRIRLGGRWGQISTRRGKRSVRGKRRRVRRTFLGYSRNDQLLKGTSKAKFKARLGQKGARISARQSWGGVGSGGAGFVRKKKKEKKGERPEKLLGGWGVRRERWEGLIVEKRRTVGVGFWDDG